MIAPKVWLGLDRIGMRCFRAVVRLAICSLAILLGGGSAGAQTVNPDCNWPYDGKTPADYRTHKAGFAAIERVHFPPQVEALIRGATTSLIGADIDYMLGKVPNHHRALLSLMHLGERLKTDRIPGTRGRVECYFQRALQFRSDDTSVRLIYATYLSSSARDQEAIHQLELATAEAADNPFTHYNIGMVYFDMKRFDRALVQAHIAYALGLGWPNLRDQLKAVGKWEESPAQPSTSSEGDKSKSSESAIESK